MSAAVFWGIGSGFQQVRGPAGSGVRGSGFTSGQMTAKIAAHGAAGGTLSVLQGGKFGHGFVSAGITEAVSPAIAGAGGSGPKGLATRAVLSAAVGGTVSKITGGKFANGAATGAFQSLFSEAASRQGSSEEPTLEEMTGMSTEELQSAVNGSPDTWLAYENTSALAKWSGAAAGADAAQYWADMQVQTGNPLYAVPGMAASLWTPDTAVATALTLTPGGVGRTVGPYLFGRGALLNSNRYLRIGYGPHNGKNVFRVAGEWLGKLPAPVRNFVGIREIKPGVFKWDF